MKPSNRLRHSGARVSANPESRDSGFDTFVSPRNDSELLRGGLAIVL
jgi:hypothetical protein